jgi:hypothetical protein
MGRFTRFFSGVLVASTLAVGAFAVVPAASAKPVLACSNGTCCTFDDVTGRIYDCRPATL